ncbi:hypothetical protein BH09BAC4_BH09BAC4_26740 [soil metagenome]
MSPNGVHKPTYAFFGAKKIILPYRSIHNLYNEQPKRDTLHGYEFYISITTTIKHV